MISSPSDIASENICFFLDWLSNNSISNNQQQQPTTLTCFLIIGQVTFPMKIKIVFFWEIFISLKWNSPSSYEAR